MSETFEERQKRRAGLSPKELYELPDNEEMCDFSPEDLAAADRALAEQSKERREQETVKKSSIKSF